VAFRLAASLLLAMIAAGCGGGTPIDEIGVGDCFDDPEDSVVTQLDLINCADPHDNEVFAELRMAQAAFPGDEGVGEYAFDACLAEFEAYVGKTYIDSSLDYTYIVPTRESWENDGDRRVLCVLYSPDLAKLTGSARR
jgi:hypothetical protein